MSTTTDEVGGFQVLTGVVHEGVLQADLPGYAPHQATLTWSSARGPDHQSIHLSPIADEVLRLHRELLRSHGPDAATWTTSPRGSLRRILRITPRQHDLHRELVELIERAAFRRDSASIASLIRVRELVEALRGDARGEAT